MRVIILGGTGAFGSGLVKLLSDLDGLEILVCGRSQAKADRFCAGITGRARLRPLALDRCGLVERIEVLAPDLVVDASGPFQAYGEEPYQVVAAAIGVGADYLDFADDGAFVAGIARFDAEARAAGVFALSGASTFPALTGAVIADLARDMEIRKVRAGLAPSPHADLGENLLRAVLGTAGAPVRLLRGGRMTRATGLADRFGQTIAPPGALPLAHRSFSLVDVADLTVIPPDHPSMTDFWVGVGTAPRPLQALVERAARLRARLKLPSYAPLAPLARRALGLFRFGAHRSGMFVEADGMRDGRFVTRSWNVVAEGDDGPLIPAMAAAVLVKRRAGGARPAPGARCATGALDLAAFETMFAGHAIRSGFREAVSADAPLFRRILGPALDTLPAPIRDFHDTAETRLWEGTATVVKGEGFLARLVGRIVGVPASATDVPVSVRVVRKRGTERWERRFGVHPMTSTQAEGQGRNARLILERFGPFTFAIALVVDGARLVYVPRHWWFFGMPMPAALLPSAETFEESHEGRFRFDVTMRAPVVGLVAAYHGWLRPAEAPGTEAAMPRDTTRPANPSVSAAA